MTYVSSFINRCCRGPAGNVATILVVEDEILVRLATADSLIAAGYSVLDAADAAEAISILEAGHEIDLVFTDIRMPGPMDGIGLTRHVEGRFPSVAVILNSANKPPHDMLGDIAFVQKPYSPETVLHAIESELGRRGWNQPARGAGADLPSVAALTASPPPSPGRRAV